MFDKRISFKLPRGYEYIEERDKGGDISYKICYGISINDDGEKQAEKTFTLMKCQKKGSLVSNIDGNYPVQVLGFAKDFNIGLSVGSSTGHSSNSQIKFKIYSGLAAIEYEEQYYIISTMSLGQDDYKSRSDAAEEIATDLTKVLGFVNLDGDPLKIKTIPQSLIREELKKENFSLKTIDETPEEKALRLEKEHVEREKRLEQERIEREKKIEKERKEREARKKAEEEKRKAEEEKRKAEEERRRKEEEKRKVEEEKARKAAEEARAKAQAERLAFEKLRLEARNNQSRVLNEKNAEIENQRIKALSDRETVYKGQIEKITSDLSGQTALLALAKDTVDAENSLEIVRIEINAEKKKAEALKEVSKLYPIPETEEEKERRLNQEERKHKEEEQEERDRIEKKKQEEAEQEKKEAERLAAEKQSNTKRKRKTIGVCVIAAIAAVLIFVFAVRPEMKYKNAVSVMENEDYDTAKALFTELDGYKDSEGKIAEIDNTLAYKAAEDALANKEFDKAEKIFKDLGDFSDSSERVQDVIDAKNADTYQQASQYYESGDYENAQKLFAGLGDYNDAADRAVDAQEKLNEALYAKAEGEYAAGDYKAAKNDYTALGDYSDAKEKAERASEVLAAQEEAAEIKSAWSYTLYFQSRQGGFFTFEFEWGQGASKPSVYFSDSAGRHGLTIKEMTKSKMVLSDSRGVTHTLTKRSTGSYNWQWQSTSRISFN